MYLDGKDLSKDTNPLFEKKLFILARNNHVIYLCLNFFCLYICDAQLLIEIYNNYTTNWCSTIVIID